MTALTEHEDDNVALAALEALGRIGGAEAVERLIGLAESGNFFRAFPAIEVLGRPGSSGAAGAARPAPATAVRAGSSTRTRAAR